MGWIGKENDTESNFGNFGVRNYDSELGRFVSVDRYWENYRPFTPYQYGANNPILMSDPSGDTIVINSPEMRKAYQEAYDYLMRNAPDQAKLLDEAQNSTEKIYLYRGNFDSNYNAANMVLTWDPTGASKNTNGSTVSPALVLLHEIGHAMQHLSRIENLVQLRKVQENSTNTWLMDIVHLSMIMLLSMRS